MLNFNQETIYSILCAMLPCIIYLLVKRRKYKIPILLIIIFVLYIWQVYDLTDAGGLCDIIYVPDGAINYSGIIKAKINLIPFNVIDRSFFLNILMLVPFGFLVPFIWKNYRKLYKTVLLGSGFSLMIELSQLITTRATDINDLIANTIGALIGYVIWKIFSLCFGAQLKESVGGNTDVICYIVLSFLGMFFLHYPFLFYEHIAPIIFK